MKTLYKYIICFLLGLISYYLLFSDAEELIEGHKCFSKDTINNFPYLKFLELDIDLKEYLHHQPKL